jgi:hypothetical protein
VDNEIMKAISFTTATKNKIIEWWCGSSYRTLAWQGQSPEFKSRTEKKN